MTHLKETTGRLPIKKRMTVYEALLKEIREREEVIQVPSVLKYPPKEVDFELRNKLEKMLFELGKFNDDVGGEGLTKTVKRLIEIVEYQIEESVKKKLETKHIFRVKNAKIESLEKLLNPPKKKKGKGGGEDLDALKDTLGL